MISIQKQFLFIHVPKTGGNSIQSILKEYSEDNIVVLNKHKDGIERFGVQNSKYNTTKHSSLSHYKSVLDTYTYRSLFKFAAIRNPWDRMISYYFSPHSGVTEWSRDTFFDLVDKTPPLREYICEMSFLEKTAIRFGMKNMTNPGKLDKDMDFLLRFEYINDDFEVVCGKLSIPFSPLPKRNASERNHYSKYYDNELKEIVRQKFIEEIEFGNYDFENA